MCWDCEDVPNSIQIYATMKATLVLCVDRTGILAEMGIFLSYRLYSLSYTLLYMHFGRKGAV